MSKSRDGRRRLHAINLFIRPAGATPLLAANASQSGYALRGWRAGGLEFRAVSDIEPDDLAQFERAFGTATPM